VNFAFFVILDLIFVLHSIEFALHIFGFYRIGVSKSTTLGHMACIHNLWLSVYLSNIQENLFHVEKYLVQDDAIAVNISSLKRNK
jgi:hypothetical protein